MDSNENAPGTASPLPVNARNTKTLQQPHPISRVPDSPAPSHPTPPSSHDFSNFTPTVDLQNLCDDRLLSTAPKADFKGTQVPFLGGIPLLAKLGQGGMGAVYYGVHPRLKQEVAVKVLPFPLLSQNPNMLERFYREAQIAAKVKSPRVVSVLDVNEEHGLFYLVMEYVSGLSAGSYTKRHYENRQLPEAVALEIVIAATEGLQAAHEQGVIHRDIKPDNILIPLIKSDFNFKQAKLADLGLARNEESGASLTGVNAAMGTPGFMSPEQALDAKNARKPADIFSLGATLYDLLTGQPPFVGESLTKVIIATLSEQHAPITHFRSDISPETLTLVDRCLKKEPNDRFYDAGEMLDALRAARWKANTGVALPPAPVLPTSQQPTVARSMPSPGQMAMAFGGAKSSTVPPLPASGPRVHDNLPSAGAKFAEHAAFAPTVVSKPGGTAAVPPRPAPKPVMTPVYMPPEKKSSSGMLYLAGAVLCAGVIGYGLFGRDPFPQDRDELIAQTQPLLTKNPTDLNRGLELVKAFETKYADKSVSEMQTVRELQEKFDNAILEQKKAQELANARKQGAQEAQTALKSVDESRFRELDSDSNLAEMNKDWAKVIASLEEARKLRPLGPVLRQRLENAIKMRDQGQTTTTTSTPAPTTTTFSEAEKDLADAYDAMKTQNYTRVEKKANNALSDPEFAKTAKAEEARKLLSQARNAQIAESKITEAERYLAGSKYQEAKDALQAAKQAYFESPLKEKIETMFKSLEGKGKEPVKFDMYDKAMSEGRRFMDNRQYGNAVYCFKKALEIKPDDKAARDGIAEAESKYRENAQLLPPTQDNSGGFQPPPPPDGQQPTGQPLPPRPGGKRPPPR